MTTNPAPITEPVVEQSGLPSLPWILFFNQTYQGDSGNVWNITFSGFTGTAAATGRYYRLSQYLVYFAINITPDGNTSSTAGTTYVDSFPLTFNNDGFNTVVSGSAGGSIGMNKASDNRIYLPTWTNVSVPLTIIGLVEAT